jgi:hypothetical protein
MHALLKLRLQDQELLDEHAIPQLEPRDVCLLLGPLLFMLLLQHPRL